MHRINIITGCIAAALTLLFSCQKNGAPDENVWRVYATSDTVTEGEDTPVHLSFTDGGLRTAEFDPETLESRLVPGLFVCGELLDIDGDCGGYNLQWAWASGRLAGRLGT